MKHRHRPQPLQPSVEQNIIQDLDAFENRLMEIMAGLTTKARRWRFFMALAIIWTMWCASDWLCDPATLELSLWDSLSRHPDFVLGCLILLISIFFFSAHRRIMQPYIVAQQTRQGLAQFNLSCDDSGRLIPKPHPEPGANAVPTTEL